MRKLLAAILATLLCSGASCVPAASNDTKTEEIQDDAEAAGKAAKSLGIVALPIPKSDPTFGASIMLPIVFLYNPYDSGRPWMSGVGAMYSTNDSWAAAAFQKAYLFDQKLRVTAGAGFASLNLNFYGIGASAGDRDISIPIQQRAGVVLVQALGQVAPATFAGLRYKLINLHTTLRGPTVPSLGLTLPDVELSNVESSFGVVGEYDTRDNEQNPHQGVYASFGVDFPREATGSDVEYNKGTLYLNYYLPLATDKVVAMRLSLCGSSGDVPFYDLCMFGVRNDLRGYEGGRFRDRTMYAVQAEYRWRFYGRWGMVAFAGFGAVGPNLSEALRGPTLPSIGAGLRYEASKDYRVNISADFAIGKDSNGFYLTIGEAF